MSRGPFTDLFVTNVLNGTAAGNGAVVNQGTVLRLTLGAFGDQPPRVLRVTTVGSGFAEQSSSTAFVLGPTGVGLGFGGTLYVADTDQNRIAAIPDALGRQTSDGTGQTVTSGGALVQPLGLAIAPDGDILTVNGGNGAAIETTPAGQRVSTKMLDKSGSPAGAGALFGLTVAPYGDGVYYVDDAVNKLRLLH